MLLIFTVPAWVGPAEPQVWSLDSFAAGTPAGKEGVPEGWSLEGRPEAQSKILLSTEERGYLALVGHGDSFGLKKELAFDLRDFPFLSWQWRVVHHPRGGDIRQKAKDDQAGQIYVIFGRFPLFLHYRALGYIWDPAAPVGFSGTSRTYSRMKYQVIRSGAGGLGQWMEESHDVQTDFRKLFQEEPPPVAGVMLFINTHFTGDYAECHYRDLYFHRNLKSFVNPGKNSEKINSRIKWRANL